MADEPNPNPEGNQPANPPANPPEDKGQPASPPAPQDNTKMAEELGKFKKENEILKNYQQQVDPVLGTLYDRKFLDEATFNKVLEAHNKRLGITPSGTEDIVPKPEAPPPSSKHEIDTRNTLIIDKVNQFNQKHGIDKLEKEVKEEVNLKIANILKTWLDPNDNKKDLAQVMEDVPLTKLEGFLDQAYFLATKDTKLKEAEEQGKQKAEEEGRGIIGSLSSESPSPETISLTAKEKDIAQRMGVTEDKFLARKKEIAQRPQAGIY